MESAEAYYIVKEFLKIERKAEIKCELDSLKEINFSVKNPSPMLTCCLVFPPQPEILRRR